MWKICVMHVVAIRGNTAGNRLIVNGFVQTESVENWFL